MENDEYEMHYFVNFLAMNSWNILKTYQECVEMDY